MNADVKCRQCGGAMRRTTKAETNISAQLFGVVVFILGFVLLFFIPVGTIIGIFLMLGALGMGYKRRKVWLCGHCGYFFERK